MIYHVACEQAKEDHSNPGQDRIKVKCAYRLHEAKPYEPGKAEKELLEIDPYAERGNAKHKIKVSEADEWCCKHYGSSYEMQYAEEHKCLSHPDV